MINHPALPLQKAILDALKNSDELMAIVTKVYDAIPDSYQFPYVALGGESYVRDVWNHECFIDLIVATEGKGRVEAKKIENIICGILDYEAIEVEGFDVDEFGLEGIEHGIETTEESRISEMTFRFLLSAEEALFE